MNLTIFAVVMALVIAAGGGVMFWFSRNGQDATEQAKGMLVRSRKRSGR